MANEKLIYVDPVTGQYSELAPLVDTFAGVNSANRVVATNASGKIDNSLINFQAFDKLFSVRSAAANNINLASPGPSVGGITLNAGDRFLVYGQTAGAENGIYVFNGDAVPATRAPDYDESVEVQAGDLVIVEEGTFAERMYVLATNNPIILGTTALIYSSLGVSLIDAGNGLSYSGTTLNVNLLAGRGLEFIGDDIAVNPSDIAGIGTIEIANQLAVDFVVSGTNNNSARAVKGSDLINFGSNQGGKIIGYDNSLTAPYTTAQTVQQAIDDAFAYAQTPGVLYVAATGGVSKGQLVYVSAAGIAAPYTDSNLPALASVSRKAIGIAATSAVAGSPVKVVTDSTVLTTVLTGATPGQTIYWVGTGVSSTIPSTLGAYVWELGTARSATDLHVDVRFLKRNSVI